MIIRHPTYSSGAFLNFLIGLTYLYLLSSPVSAKTSINPSRKLFIPRDTNNVREAKDSKGVPDYIAHTASGLVCRPFGECEPCPEDERQQPFCLPFGNRRLLHCIPAESQDNPYDENSGSQPPGEVPAWEACGKVIKQERHDFWEFVTANVLFLMVALTILWARSSALATAQYRQLAARIGIPGGSWRA